MPDAVRYVVRTEGRVSAARSAEKGHHTVAHEVIPGATIRGAFAALWWLSAREHGRTDEDFRELFDRRLSVRQAVPVGSTLCSASTWLCKYRPEQDCAAFALDAAVELAAERAVADLSCAVCHGPVHTRPGWHSARPITVRTTSTQLDDRGVAATGNLFARDSLVADLSLAGSLGGLNKGDDLSWLDGQPVRIGGKRSVLGGATVALQTVVVDRPVLDERVALRLTSPAVLVDRYGAATLAVDELVGEIARVSQEPVALVPGPARRAWLRSEHLTGWHMRSALPKPAEWAVAAGSTLVVTGLTDRGWARLGSGIGLRSLEGYGMLELLDPAAPVPPPVPAPGRSVEPPGPAPTPVEQLVAALTAAGHLAQVTGVADALRSLKKARAARWGPSEEQVVRNELRKPWVKSLDPVSRSLLQRLLETVEDTSVALQELDRAARRHRKAGGR